MIDVVREWNRDREENHDYLFPANWHIGDGSGAGFGSPHGKGYPARMIDDAFPFKRRRGDGDSEKPPECLR